MNETVQAILNNADAEPLDLLNKWWSGIIDNGAFHVLMQRALLKSRARSLPVADPDAFAQQRRRTVPTVVSTIEQIIAAFKKNGPFAVSDERYEHLKNALLRMEMDGFRTGSAFVDNVVAGEYGLYEGYRGFKQFRETIEELHAGNSQ